MEAGRNTEIDFILVNLLSTEPLINNLSLCQAEQHRKINANVNLPSSKFGFIQLKDFYTYGPGVTLYFSLVKSLILVFFIISIISLPAMLCNFSGDGLRIYDSGFKILMQLSLGNQPFYQYKNISEDTNILSKIQLNKAIITITDILISIIFLYFILYFQCYSNNLVWELNQTKPLPSYYTLLVSNLQNVPSRQYTQSSLVNHFKKYGNIAQISTVYDYGHMLEYTKDFMILVKKYRDSKTKSQKQQIYTKLQQKYQIIKNMRPSLCPIYAFITYQSLETRNHVYHLHKYNIDFNSLQYNHTDIKVNKCEIQPISIIWENFHIKSDFVRKFIVWGILGCVGVLGIVGLYIVRTEVMNIDKLQSFYQDPEFFHHMKPVTYEEAFVSTDPKIIFAFCSQLTYKTFQWRYYGICENYFTSFSQPTISILLFSLLTLIINFIVYKIIYLIAQIRKHSSWPGRQKFLIINIFLVYFVNNALLVLLISGNYQGKTFNDIIGLDQVYPTTHINQYEQFNRKWYMDAGKQIIINFIVSGIFCPFLFVGYEWLLSKYQYYQALKANNQKQMNEILTCPQFDFQYFYALTLCVVFFTFTFGTALPILYPLAAISILSIYLCSQIIFKYFSKKPFQSDHSLNQSICKILILAIIFHQFMSPEFINVDDIFLINYGKFQFTSIYKSSSNYLNHHLDEVQNSLFQKLQKGPIFFIVMVIGIIFLTFYTKITEKFTKFLNKYHPSIVITQTSKFTQLYPNKKLESESKVTQQHNVTPNMQQNIKKKHAQLLSSYRMQQNPSYAHIVYTLTVLDMFLNNQLSLSDQEVIRINQWIQDYEVKSQRYVLSQAGQYELREVDLVETQRNMSF